MPERTSYPHGTFSWIDLATSDLEGAKSFYSELFGWQFEDMPAGGDGIYSMARKDGHYVAAAAVQQEDERAMGIPVHWNSYITVDGVDAVAEKAGGLGANVAVPPFDVLDAGRMAVLADPTGGFVCLWEPRRHPGAGLVNAPGALCWNELTTREPERAAEFWSALLDWKVEKMEGMPVDYWTIQNQGRANGGIRRMGDESPEGTPAHWLAYFATDSVEETGARAEALGGKVHVPRTPLPMGAFAALTDPQGAGFLLYEGQLDD